MARHPLRATVVHHGHGNATLHLRELVVIDCLDAEEAVVLAAAINAEIEDGLVELLGNMIDLLTAGAEDDEGAAAPAARGFGARDG